MIGELEEVVALMACNVVGLSLKTGPWLVGDASHTINGGPRYHVDF